MSLFASSSDPTEDVLHSDVGFTSLTPVARSAVAEAALRALQLDRRRTVYTAFDGDHFGFLSLMRRNVLLSGHVPANPESIVGYRDSVLARQSKVGVMLDDLAILGGCDELWVYTNVSPHPAAVARDLAEGALIELLYFLAQRGADSEVHFVSLPAVAASLPASPERYSFSYAQTVAELGEDQAQIRDVVERVRRGDLPLPTVAAVLHHPLDTKYVHWLRAGGYRDSRSVPLVPQLAVEAGETVGLAGLEAACAPSAVSCWASLLRLAEELIIMPSVSPDQRDSLCVDVLLRLWETSRRPVEKREWERYGTPKATAGRLWPISDRERERSW